MIGQVDLSSHPSKVYRMLSKVAAPPRDAKRKNVPINSNTQKFCKASSWNENERPVSHLQRWWEADTRHPLCKQGCLDMYFPHDVCLCLGSVNIDLTRRYSGQLESSSCPYLFSVLPRSDWIQEIFASCVHYLSTWSQGNSGASTKHFYPLNWSSKA